MKRNRIAPCPRWLALLSFLLCLLATAKSGALAADPQPLDFNRDIRPILSEHCFACHGFDEKARQAELRLDLAESAYSDKSGARAIAPGDLAKSEAWRRINSADADELMPPPKSNLALADADKVKLRRWIEEGAKYSVHWSFIPPVKAALPQVSDSAWTRNEIDRFVLAKLDAEGLKPAAAADRRMYIRRVSLDLTGLPPSAEEVEAFVADRDDRAAERLVDRLLDSPHFGERMSLDWLDAARYADTNGYSIDGGRHLWLWRDWVIHAFNSGMPYDQFVLEQLAGDLLPNPTPGSAIATGFQRNNMVTHEGGTIPDENLLNYNADRVKTLGESMLGLTLGCAQCHDHKYDPITQRDYYRLLAYFNTVSDVGLDGNGGVNPKPYLQARTVLQTGEEKQIAAELQALRERLATPDVTQLADWEAEQRRQLAVRGQEFRLLPAEPLKVSTPNRGAGFELEGDQVLIKQAGDLIAYDVSLKLPTTDLPITGLRVVFYPDEHAAGGGWGFGPAGKKSARQPVAKKMAAKRRKSNKLAADQPAAEKPSSQSQAPGSQPAEQPADPAPPDAFKGNFVLTAFSASADVVPGDQINLHRLLGVNRVTANSWQTKYPPEDCLDTRNENGWSPDLDFDGPVHLTVTFAEPLSVAKLPYLTVQLNFGHGKSLVAKRFGFQMMTGCDDDSPLPADIIAILAANAADRSPEQQQLLRDHFAAHAEATLATRVAIENLEERLAVLTQEFSTMVMDTAAKPRDTYILHRGDYSQRRDKVTAGTLAALPPAPAAAPGNRLGLAQWVVMRDNPLTARVAVNRFWSMIFGAGLVRTTADLGSQGEAPSHPELLDWLAVDFMDSGWSVKAILRRMVLSATYRQTSATSAALLERDPQNRLLARGPRFRLPAEIIRDSALKVSGLLSPRLGGPSVNPYSPADLWREVSHYGSTPATAQSFVQDHGEKLYRRSLYTFWKRTVPPPNMAAFDAPTREVCVVSRPSTTTPLQALVLLNDVQFVEAGRAFAQRIITHDADDTGRLRWAFYECVSRPPTEQEIGVLASTLRRERQRYAAHESAARAYLANGESPRDESIPVGEHAAWSQVAALLLNLSETVTRN